MERVVEKRAPKLQGLLLTERMDFAPGAPFLIDTVAHQKFVKRALMQATPVAMLRYAAAPALPLSTWALDTMNRSEYLFWTGPQPYYATGVDTTALRRQLMQHYGTDNLWRIPATWFSGQISMHLNYWDYCGTRVCLQTHMAKVSQGASRNRPGGTHKKASWPGINTTTDSNAAPMLTSARLNTTTRWSTFTAKPN